MAVVPGPLGITVIVIGPGLTLTDAVSGLPKEMHEQAASITPVRRLATPEDIAGVAVFSATTFSNYLNGEDLPVTCGNYMIQSLYFARVFERRIIRKFSNSH